MEISPGLLLCLCIGLPFAIMVGIVWGVGGAKEFKKFGKF